MHKSRILAGGLFAIMAFGSTPLSAHHSFALFDNTKEVTLKGTIRQFQWTNPHCWIQLTVMVGGKAVEYSIEGTSPNNLSRFGWKRNSLKVGDKVTITFHPLRDGGKGGSFNSVTLPNGRVLSGQV